MSEVNFSEYANFNYFYFSREDSENIISPLVRPLIEFQYGNGKGIKWGKDFDEPITLSWSIANSSSSFLDWHYGWSPPINERLSSNATLEEINAIKKAYESWEKYANISFNFIEEDKDTKGNIRTIFIDMGNTGIAYLAPYGEFHINNNLREDLIDDSSSFAEHIVAHEIGHAVFGLNDVSRIKGWDQVDGEKGELLPWYFNNQKWTIMSYIPVGGNYVKSPMILDVLAIQELYGKNNNTGSGNNIYTWEEYPLMTLWDASGEDTIDLSNFEENIIINTEPGNLIEINQKSYIGIAFGVEIENFITGSGNDSFKIADFTKSIDSGDGDDIFLAKSNLSNIAINGGSGTDILFSNKLGSLNNFTQKEFLKDIEIYSNFQEALNTSNKDFIFDNNQNSNSEIYLSISNLGNSQETPEFNELIGKVFVPNLKSNSLTYSETKIDGLHINPLGYIFVEKELEKFDNKSHYIVQNNTSYEGEFLLNTTNENNTYKYDLNQNSEFVEIIDVNGLDTLELSLESLTHLKEIKFTKNDLTIKISDDSRNGQIRIQNQKSYGCIEKLKIITDKDIKEFQLLPDLSVMENAKYFYENDTQDFLFNYEKGSLITGEDYGDGVYSSPSWKVDEYINDSLGDDLIFGNKGSEDIFLKNGNDLIYCGEGNDRVIGSTGNDTIYGEEGNDWLYGEYDYDLSDGGNDFIYGGDGDDFIRGLGGSDYIDGGNGDDEIEADWTYERDYSDWGDDNIQLSHGNDRVWGGEGDDSIVVDNLFHEISSISGSIKSLEISTTSALKGNGISNFYDFEQIKYKNKILTLDEFIKIYQAHETVAIVNSSYFADPKGFSSISGSSPVTITSYEIGQETTLSSIKDYDGNLHAGDTLDTTASSYKYQGMLDVNGDGVFETIFTNKSSKRWVTGSVDSITGQIDFSDHGQGGTTRVVGIYIDPLVTSGEVEQFGPHDSQRRFQNDLKIDNLLAKTSGDYDGDGFQEVYWKTNDGTAYLRALMHADGNIQYANYQSEAQMSDYLTSKGYADVISDIV